MVPFGVATLCRSNQRDTVISVDLFGLFQVWESEVFQVAAGLSIFRQYQSDGGCRKVAHSGQD